MSRMRCSAQRRRKRVHARLRRDGAERCTADPGPPQTPNPLRSRVCSASLRFASCCAAPGTQILLKAMAKNSPPDVPSLADLRREIDRIDAAMHGLLMERGEI